LEGSLQQRQFYLESRFIHVLFMTFTVSCQSTQGSIHGLLDPIPWLFGTDMRSFIVEWIDPMYGWNQSQLGRSDPLLFVMDLVYLESGIRSLTRGSDPFVCVTLFTIL